jgi:DNA-binding XRE family transcriptional regulator
MISDIPMVKKVRPTGARKLRVRFAGDRREYVLDLTGLIARSQHFAPLMEDADTFAKIDIVDDGLGVAWPVETKWGHLDLSGSTLRRMAEEQSPMSGADFAKWRKSLGLSLTEAAKLLGVGRRTIMGYLKKMSYRPSSRSLAGRWRATSLCLQPIMYRPEK